MEIEDMEIKYLHIICSYYDLCSKVMHYNDSDHTINMKNIIKDCKDLIDKKNLQPYFDPHLYIYNYIQHKDEFWDYKTNSLDLKKVFYTWITVGFRNKLNLYHTNHDLVYNTLYNLQYYNSYFWYIKIKRPHVKKKYDAFIKGLDTKQVIKVSEVNEDGCGLFAGVLDGNMKRLKTLKSKRFLYIDNAYTNNLFHKYYSLASNDLQSLCQYSCDDNRLKLMYEPKIFIQQWKPNGKYILICPPSLTQGEFYNIDINQWIHDIIKQIRNITEQKIIVRIKPTEFTYNSDDTQKNRRKSNIQNKLQCFLNYELKNDSSSSKAIDESSCVITFNSRIGIEAFLEGKPLYCSKHCVAYTVSQKSIENSVLNPKKQTYSEYLDFIRKMSYSHWTLSEIGKGDYINYITLY